MINSFKSGLFYSVIGKYGNMLIQLLVNAVLSRMLSPEDHGVLAIMMVFIVFFQMLSDMGFGPAIIQNKELDSEDITALFNFSVIFSLFLAVLFGLSGYGISYIYRSKIYIPISWLLSIAVLFNGLLTVPNSVLLKEKNFKSVNIRILLSSIIGGLVGIVLAFLDFKVYALAYSTITTAFVNFIITFKVAKITNKYNFKFSAVKKIWGFSKNQFGFSFLNYFSRNADNILIGRFMGASMLGNYSKAYQLLMLPTNVFTRVIVPVLQPVLSDYENNVLFIRNFYYKVLHFLFLIGLPLSVFLSVSAKEIIYFVFGRQWNLAIEPFAILSLTVWTQMVYGSIAAIYQSRNKTKHLLIMGIVNTIINVISIIIGVYFKSLNSVSLFLTMAFLLNFLFSFWMLSTKVLNSKLSEIFKLMIRPLIISILVFIGLKGVELFINIESGSFISLVVKGIVYILVFLLSCMFMGEIKEVKNSFLNEK